jgi:hypothetical protein
MGFEVGDGDTEGEVDVDAVGVAPTRMQQAGSSVVHTSSTQPAAVFATQLLFLPELREYPGAHSCGGADLDWLA